jgi:cysteine desulfurase / selenocysteine lyase
MVKRRSASKRPRAQRGATVAPSTRREFLSTCGVLAVAANGHALERQATPATVWPSSFPALGQDVNGHRLAYLDSGATTLRPQSVIDALVDYYATDNANPAKVHRLAARAAERLSLARLAVARFLHAADPLEVVFVRGTTEGLNLVASTWGGANLKRGDEIVVSIAEHYSNLLPWRRAAEDAGALVRVADVDDEGRLMPDRLAAVLSKRTKLVAFSHVSNVLGYVNPVRDLTAAAKQVGATVVVDGAQGAPHVVIDVQDLGCDVYVFSGHKMLGPMGTGVVWARRALLDAMPPYHVGSNMAHAVTATGAELEHGALKYQAGTPDVAGPVGLHAAVSFFEQAGRAQLQRHDEMLATHGLLRLREVPGLRLIGPTSAAQRVPVFTFTIPGVAAATVAANLDQQGIAVRAGDMAALPLLRRFGVTEAVRASAYVYTTPAEIDRLVAALQQMRASPQ